VPFFLADRPWWTWNRIYVLLAAMWIPIMIAVILAREGKQNRRRFEEAEQKIGMDHEKLEVFAHSFDPAPDAHTGHGAAKH